MLRTSEYKLSICIPTFNRAAFLAQTLACIIDQLSEGCEIVVSDNASTDNTEAVVLESSRRCESIRYHKQQTNTGFDRNLDRAVDLARGEFCWLMPDDDRLKPGAVQAVLQAMRDDVSLITLNVEFRDLSLSRVIQRGALGYTSDKVYEPDDLDSLYLEVGTLHGYVGSIVMRRSVWLDRNRERYFGSGWIYLAMIYQARLPGKAVVIARPLVDMRLGNIQEWWSRMFEMVMRGPAFTESLAISDVVKQRFRGGPPWKNIHTLLWLRALGAYTLGEYRGWIRPKLQSRRERAIPYLIARTPFMFVNSLFVIYYMSTRRNRHGYSVSWVLALLKQGRDHQPKRCRLLPSSSVHVDQMNA
jgi:abequosyltransferase